MFYSGRYPRSYSYYPILYDALFNGCPDNNIVPVSISLNVQKLNSVLVFVHLIRIALIAKKGEKEYRTRIQRACWNYLNVDGNTSTILNLCKEVLNINIKIIDEVIPVKKYNLSRRHDFERRLDLYRNPVNIMSHISKLVESNLLELHYPGKNGSNFKLLPCGMRENTSLTQLFEAVDIIEDKVIKSFCRTNIESLAIELWNWKYPVISDQVHKQLLDDFDEVQNSLKRKNNCQDPGCPNSTIRMLFHFDRIKFPFSIEMFKVPAGSDTWIKNLEKLEI